MKRPLVCGSQPRHEIASPKSTGRIGRLAGFTKYKASRHPAVFPRPWDGEAHPSFGKPGFLFRNTPGTVALAVRPIDDGACIFREDMCAPNLANLTSLQMDETERLFGRYKLGVADWKWFVG